MRLPRDHGSSHAEPTLVDIVQGLHDRAVKDVLVVGTQHRQVIPATLQTMHDATLCVHLHSTVLLRQRGERLLVFCAVPPQEHYILPAWLHEVYFDRLVLQCQPPQTEVASDTEHVAESADWPGTPS